MRRKLEYHADRIETVLQQHNLPGRIAGGTVTPRWISFQFIPAIGAKVSAIKARAEEIALALEVDACRISRKGAAVTIEIPRDDPKPVRLLPLYQQLTTPNQNQIPPATAILGLAEDGAPLLIRLPSPNVSHILIAGTTGSGKTVLLRTMITSLAITNPASSLALFLIDPKRHAFTPFANLPHLAHPIASDIDKIITLLDRIALLMDQRGTQAPGDHTIIVVIDELADIIMVGGKRTQTVLTRLTQRGREAGIHIIAATQKPTSAVLGPLIKANFPVRLVGRVTSAEDARTATGWSGTGAERLSGSGDFVAVAEGRTIRFQTAHITREEIGSFLDNHHNDHDQNKTLFLPRTKPQPSQDTILAQKLTEWEQWPHRHDPDDPTQYTWGFKTKACKFLLGKDLAGTWAKRLNRILVIAEETPPPTTTATSNTPKNTPPPTLPWNESSSRNPTILHASKPAIATALTPTQPLTFTDTDVLILSSLSFIAGTGLLLTKIGLLL